MEEDTFSAALHDAIQGDNPSQIRSLLGDLEWVDIADILTHSPPPTRRALWKSFDETLKGDVIAVFRDFTLSIIIAFAMVLNITIAALSGSLLPKILTALRIDPAVAGMVVLTTITDVVGFLSFLGLATYIYA